MSKLRRFLTTLFGSGQVQPKFLSGEAGGVTVRTVSVTFNCPVLTSDYAAGVTITLNSVSQTIVSAIRQSNLRTVYFVLTGDISLGDVITWAYTKSAGSYTNLSATKTLENVSAQTLVNSILPVEIWTLDFSTDVTSAWVAVAL